MRQLSNLSGELQANVCGHARCLVQVGGEAVGQVAKVLDFIDQQIIRLRRAVAAKTTGGFYLWATIPRVDVSHVHSLVQTGRGSRLREPANFVDSAP